MREFLLPYRKVTLKADKISEYFAEDCSSEEIEGIINQLLDEWSARNGMKRQ